MTLDQTLITAVTGIEVTDMMFGSLGLVTASRPGTLTFIDDDKYFGQLVSNGDIAGAFVGKQLGDDLRKARPDLKLIVTDDPRWAYYTLYNAVGKAEYRNDPSCISADAVIHPTAFVSPHNVAIGAGTVIGPNVTILPDVIIGSQCVIQAGTVIGSDGFEYKRTSHGILFVFHDGRVEIGDQVHVGANACIDKGFRDRPTIIGDGAMVDNLVHVAHSARIGKRTLVIAGTVLGGSSTIGEDSWLSINCSIAPGIEVGSNAFASIGAVVTRPVADGEQVTGNFAVPHALFLRALKDTLSRMSTDPTPAVPRPADRLRDPPPQA